VCRMWWSFFWRREEIYNAVGFGEGTGWVGTDSLGLGLGGGGGGAVAAADNDRELNVKESGMARAGTPKNLFTGKVIPAGCES
jgi:hypothetical protein